MPPLTNDPKPAVPLDLEAIRQKLASAQGQTYWRSLEELAETESFQELLHREFPDRASEWTNPLTRRRFLMLMGASLALAGLTGCGTRPTERIVPYVKEPEGIIPGKPLFFATAMPLAGLVSGVLVESHMGRPTKIEGNPDHPASKGATDSYAQASILGLYDPDRAQTITSLGKVRTWDDTVSELRAELAKLKPNKSSGLRILTGRINSPTLTARLLDLFMKFPGAKWHSYEPAVSDNPLEGALLAFNQQVQPRYQIDKADVILSLDSDFLSCGPGHLRYVREFSARRTGKPAEMNRLYVAESLFTTTGACADHHLPIKAGEIEGLARAIAAKVGVPGIEASAPVGLEKWVQAVADDLKFLDGDEKKGKRPAGSTVVIAGEGQPPVVHALAHALNAVLDNINKTVVYIRPLADWTSPRPSTLKELTTAMQQGEVEVLLILGGNPVFNAPADLDFAQKMKEHVRLRIHLAPYFDETSALCQWHLPEAHYLETWGDGRAFDGTATIMQPLIAPLYNGKSAMELVSALIDPAPLTGYEMVRAYWQKQWQERKDRSGTFDSFWKGSLHNGVVPGTASESIGVTLKRDFAQGLPAASAPGKKYEIVFRPDPALFDGQFANNGWLQELPKPLTRLCWDNAAIMSPKTAKDLGVTLRIGPRGGEHGETYADMVTLQVSGRKLTLPAWILPGHADDSITVHFGYGRQRAGKVGTGTGFDVYQLRGWDQPWFASDVSVEKAGKTYLLACTQAHHSMEGRDLLRSGTVMDYEKDHHFAQRPDEHHAKPNKDKNHKDHKDSTESKRRPLTLYEPWEYKGHKWGMVINLSACVGCGACVVACQAENNIPVVGKEEVNRGREMHWLRIDRYFSGDPFTQPQQVQALHQPVPCMQCENAPCEQVCPVEATAHSFDGLNDMVYNRCVGTRYCSNNCPYKVRRFNFLQYAKFDTPSLKLMYNPEVTVRSRGVMEKCTYCVQRIRAGEIAANREQRPLVNGQNVSLIRDGEVLTACQAVCPAQAIIFGDLTGPDASGKDGTHSKVAHLRGLPGDDSVPGSPLNYSMLAELNTNPRTTYLAALRNPNPKLAEAHGD